MVSRNMVARHMVARNMVARKFCALMLAMCLASALTVAPAAAQYAPPPTPATATYVVRAGDTLFSIAARYHTDVQSLAKLNGIVNPTMIYVGQALNVPAAAPSAPAATPTVTPTTQANTAADMVYTVQAGETLYRIAARYGTTAWALASYNKLDSANVVYAGQRLLIPSGSKSSSSVPAVPSLPDPFVSIEVAPLPVIQGNTVAVTVLTSRDVSLNGTFLDWAVPFARDGNTFYGLIGIHAMQKAGVSPFTIIATDANGRQASMTMSIQVLASKFAYETIKVPANLQYLMSPEIATAERDKLFGVFNSFSPTRYWSGLFAMPSAGNIASVFGSRREYLGGEFNKFHEGVDIVAPTGAPVAASAEGIVALAEPLKVRGGAIILNHGGGVYTGYWHLSSIDVKVGQRVRQGQVIGKVGSTGLSTGSHLHWEMRVRGVTVDPMQWTRRIFP
jgi:murein DD-endopeptidase MepM/ murein hydrolase activator NlpD